MLIDDVLSPSESAKFIVERGTLVKINETGVKKVAEQVEFHFLPTISYFCSQILEAAKNGTLEAALFLSPELHPKNGDKEAVQWYSTKVSLIFEIIYVFQGFSRRHDQLLVLAG